jgi:hypothetical protein
MLSMCVGVMNAQVFVLNVCLSCESTTHRLGQTLRPPHSVTASVVAIWCYLSLTKSLLFLRMIVCTANQARGLYTSVNKKQQHGSGMRLLLSWLGSCLVIEVEHPWITLAIVLQLL